MDRRTRPRRDARCQADAVRRRRSRWERVVMNHDHRDRYIMALYYGYGRQDAANWEQELDPIRFAEHYAALWADVESGRSSFCPSVQDAWEQFRRSLAS